MDTNSFLDIHHCTFGIAENDVSPIISSGNVLLNEIGKPEVDINFSCYLKFTSGLTEVYVAGEKPLLDVNQVFSLLLSAVRKCRSSSWFDVNFTEVDVNFSFAELGF